MTEELRDPPDDAAWVNVPDSVAADLDRFADHCRALVTAWLATARGGAVPLGAGSPAAIEAGQFRRARPEAPKNVEHGPGQQAGLYVDAISQHLLAIEALLRARRVGVALWPLVRAELELAGRVGWLLDPRVLQPSGEVRVARLYLEMISSFQRDRYTAAKFDGAGVKRSKTLRDQKLAEAQVLFDQVEVDLSSPDKLGGWKIGGESLPGLGAAVNAFVEVGFKGESKAIYDILSDYSHPSLSAITRQTTPVELDGTAMRPWTVEIGTVERQIHYACVIFYKAAHLVASYHELDASPLEQWADGVPVEWFGQDESDVVQ